MRRFSILLVTLAACSTDRLHQTVPEVEVDARIGFGNPFVGDTVRARFGVHSQGTGRVQVTRIASSHAEIELAWDDRDTDRRGTPVDPGHTLDVVVTWRPIAVGAHHDTIVVETDVDGSENWVVNTLGWARAIPSCDDDNPCTTDHFDRDSETCVHQNNANVCNDGNGCTRDDKCFEGECRGLARRCDDDDVCTYNLCDPASGCYFPPDPMVCDDGDPCTDNICDPDDGCSYPESSNGTPCGPFDCAIGHTCFFGSCRPWDISSQTEGVPCSDGDHCTDGDACHAGECESGELIQTNPEIVATIETFGGEGSTVATDGYRYLFADRDKTRVAIIDAEGSLEHVATLPVVGTSIPILLSAGKFVLGSGGQMLLIDATDVEAPVIAWSLTVADYGAVAHLARVTDGVVFAIAPTGVDAGFIAPPEVGPYFLPIAEDGTPGATTVLAFDFDIRDLDADGRKVAWVSGTVMHFVEMAPDGSVANHVQYPNTTLMPLRRVSILDQTVAVLGTSVGVYRVVAPASVSLDCSAGLPCEQLSPGCGQPPLPEAGLYAVNCGTMQAECPLGTSCQMVSVSMCDGPGETCDACGMVRDVCVPDVARFEPLTFLGLAINDLALTAAADTTNATWHDLDSADGVSAEDRAYSYWTTPIDPLTATRLDRVAGHVLLSGPIALPLLTEPASGAAEPPTEILPPATRVTGPRHGNVRTIVDASDTEIFVAGDVALGRINVLDASVVEWWLSERGASAAEPRILRGQTRDTAITHQVGWSGSSYYPIDPQTECRGSMVDVIGVNGWNELIACDHLGGTQAVAGDRLWAFGPEPVMNSLNTALRAWSFDGGAPVFDWQPVDLMLTDWWLTRVRAASTGAQIVATAPVGFCGDTAADAAALHVVVFDANAGGDPLLVATQLPVSATMAVPDLHRVAVDGTQGMVAEWTDVQLWDLLSTADPVGPRVLAIPEADPGTHVSIPWMAAGRAWVAWDAGIDSIASGPYLTQVTYGALLERDGDLLLEQPAEEVVDAGQVTLVTTRAGVHVVTPACR